MGRRCSYGSPEVINTPPDIDEVAFPTTYWLTCPTRVKKVSRLEGSGWIGKLEAELAVRTDWQSDLKTSAARQIAARRALGKNKGGGACENLLSLGIAGTAELLSLKCLHAHLADFLIGGVNPVGEKVAQLLGEITCSSRCPSDKPAETVKNIECAAAPAAGDCRR